MRPSKELLPLLFLLPAAYLGGLFFGKNPEFFYYLHSQPAVRIGIVGEIPAAAFHELSSVGKVQIQSITWPQDPRHLDMDLVWLTNLDLEKGNIPWVDPESSARDLVFPHLTSSREKALPVLWNISECKILKWMLAEKSKHPDNHKIRDFFLTEDFQEKLSRQYSGFRPSLRKSLSSEEQAQILSVNLVDGCRP